MKTFTADEFRRNPGIVYLEAYRASITGGSVVINHGNYADLVFEIKPRPRGEKWEEDK